MTTEIQTMRPATTGLEPRAGWTTWSARADGGGVGPRCAAPRRRWCSCSRAGELASLMQSLRGIYVVSGRPVPGGPDGRGRAAGSAPVAHGGVDRGDLHHRDAARGRGPPCAQDVDDGRRQASAGHREGTWSQYPAQMLRHRCAADLAREVYPDVLMGLYDPDESRRRRARPRRGKHPVRDDAPRRTRPSTPSRRSAPTSTRRRASPSTARERSTPATTSAARRSPAVTGAFALRSRPAATG